MNTRFGFAGVGCIALVLLAGAACGKKADTTADAGPTAPATVPGTDQVTDVKVGDEVVVVSGKASFWRGKIAAVEGNKITYEYGSNKSTSTTDKGDVYVLPKGDHKAVEKAGDFVICRTGSDSWEGCVVKTVNGAVFVCESSGASSHNLAASDLILPKPATQANIKEYLETYARHRAFNDAAKAAGKPLRPAGWKARPGADVLAQFAGSSWYGAKVTKVTADKITVAWEDKSGPAERRIEEVVPKPAGPQKVAADQFVIVRPGTSSYRWDYAKVTSVTGASVVVADEDGKPRTVSTKDVCPIVP